MAFDFPNPPTAEPVTNPATGITYTYDASTQTWVVSGSGAADALETELDGVKGDISALETSQGVQDERIQALEDAPDPVTDLGNYYTKPQTYSQAEVNNLIDNIDTGGGDVNLDNYYTKDEIDNQFTLRGVGYTYLVSSFSGTITIRPGELHTNNRNVGQITQISLGPEDDNGKQRRNAVIGDTIEIYDLITTKYYRYEINIAGDGSYGVTFVGSDDDRNDPLSMGESYLIYLYPTHISSANYYDKAAADDRFMSKKPGAMENVQRGFNFQAACEYTGAVQYSNNIANKRYVDESIAGAGFASVQYVNDEVDKMIISFNAEAAEPDIFYGDYAPTGTMKDGNIWFDAMHLRLNIWSQGAWINPDRNDGASLENRITALEARLAQLEGN